MADGAMAGGLFFIMDIKNHESNLDLDGKDLGLDLVSQAQLVEQLKNTELGHAVQRLEALREENLHLRRQVEALQADHQRMGSQLEEIGGLIGCTRPHKLIHDLRNVLNELVLLRTLLNEEGSSH